MSWEYSRGRGCDEGVGPQAVGGASELRWVLGGAELWHGGGASAWRWE